MLSEEDRTRRLLKKMLALARLEAGPPLPAEALRHLFDRFYRVDASRTRQTGGVGLGLAIARTLVQRHGGDIGVQSAATGTTFTIHLPERVAQQRAGGRRGTSCPERALLAAWPAMVLTRQAWLGRPAREGSARSLCCGEGAAGQLVIQSAQPQAFREAGEGSRAPSSWRTHPSKSRRRGRAGAAGAPFAAPQGWGFRPYGGRTPHACRIHWTRRMSAQCSRRQTRSRRG